MGSADGDADWHHDKAVLPPLSSLNTTTAVDSPGAEAKATDNEPGNVRDRHHAAVAVAVTSSGSGTQAMDANVSTTESMAGSTLYDYANDTLAGNTAGNITSVEDALGVHMPLNVTANPYAVLAKGRILSMELLNGTQSTSTSIHGYINESWPNGTNLTIDAIVNDNTSMGMEHVGLPPGFGYPYPSAYTWVHIILAAIVVSVIIFFIVAGNAMVMIAIAQDRNLNVVQNYFIGSLAMSDLLLGLLIMPLSLANELMGYWYFGEMLCDMWLSVDVLLCTASILNLCLISLDRYWSVTRAVSYVRTRTRKRAFIMIAMVWMLSAMICFPPLAGWKRPQPKAYGFNLCMLSEEIGYVVYSTLGSFYIPLAVMVIVYFKIYLAARSRARRNLKKKTPLPMAPTNGKSTSSSTTTSFSQPQNKAVNTTTVSVSGGNKESYSGEGDDDDEIAELETPALETHEPDLSGTGTDSFDPDPEKGQGIKLCVTNHNAHFKPTDEKKKLLSEDTDTDACETPTRQSAGTRLATPKKIHFSEDTEDSAPEYLYCNQYTTDYRDGSHQGHAANEENLKPLLEDSQPDSESQRDSDRNGNNKVRTEAEQADKQTLSVVPTVHVQQGSDVGDGTPPKKKRKAKSHTKPGLMTDAKKKMDLLSPNSIRKMSLRRHPKDKPTSCREDPDRMKRKIARAKERRAILVLGIIMVTFIICWLPFFSLYLISILSGLNVPRMVFAVTFWAGYCNSALNPIIYTIFNKEFQTAFQKMLCGRRCR